MKISVIIPTYKPQSYLWECLESVYDQTFPKTDYELVLVLNGCKEPYNTQINDWILRHDDLYVQYVQTNDCGVSNARNIALDAAAGEYVTFIDDDDFVSPMYLSELYKKAMPDTVSMCYPYAFNDGSLNEQLQYSVTDAYDYCITHGCHKLTSKARKYFSGPCMKLISMSIIQGRRYDRHFKIGEDSLFMFLISDKVNKVSFTSKKSIYYRRYRKDSASFANRSIKEQVSNNLRLIMEYIKIFSHGGYASYFFITRVASRVREIVMLPIEYLKRKEL